MALTREDIMALVDEHRPDLLECVEAHDMLLAQLVKLKLLQHSWCQNLEGKNRAGKVGAILDFFRVGTVDQFHGFVKALEITNQGAAVSFLKRPTETSPEASVAATAAETPCNPSTDETPSSTAVQLWSEEHPNGKDVVLYNKEYKDLLNDNRIQLAETLDITRLWPHLRQMHVLDGRTMSRIKHAGIEVDQVDQLIDYLNKNSVWKLHAFFRACVIDGQEQVLWVLGLNKDTYRD